jgi:hypothetical protein
MCGEMPGLVWWFGGRLGWFVVEDPGIGLVE